MLFYAYYTKYDRRLDIAAPLMTAPPRKKIASSFVQIFIQKTHYLCF